MTVTVLLGRLGIHLSPNTVEQTAPERDADADIDARLEAATATVLAEISRTDTKSGVLLSTFSLPLAALLAFMPGRALSAEASVLLGTGTASLIAATLTVLLAAVRPRLRGARRGSFLYWSKCTPTEVLDDLRSPVDRAGHLIYISQIARRKYAALRLAVDLTAVALVALAAGILTALA
ncbi:Pycsar system effector family protein [Streptomyces sp. NPDC017979]|uniref:Pycsar system effector family protein n=1 Tax=Streptomyces sp. NPDC017979 TaxID=3365024 RepID=UPI00379E6D5F